MTKKYIFKGGMHISTIQLNNVGNKKATVESSNILRQIEILHILRIVGYFFRT